MSLHVSAKLGCSHKMTDEIEIYCRYVQKERGNVAKDTSGCAADTNVAVATDHCTKRAQRDRLRWGDQLSKSCHVRKTQSSQAEREGN